MVYNIISIHICDSFSSKRKFKMKQSKVFPFLYLSLLIYILSDIAPFIFLQKRNRKLFLCFLHRLKSTKTYVIQLSTNIFLKFFFLFFCLSWTIFRQHSFLYLHSYPSLKNKKQFTDVLHDLYSNSKH